MAKQQIFEYAILYHPTEKKDSDGNIIKRISEVVVPMSSVLASNEKEAMMLIARMIPEKFLSDLDCIEIALRPF